MANGTLERVGPRWVSQGQASSGVASMFPGTGSEATMANFNGAVAGTKEFINSGQANTQQGTITAGKLQEQSNIAAALYQISTKLDALWFTTLYGGFNTIVQAIQQALRQ